MDTENANGGAGGYAGTGDVNQRQRFHVELKPGQTNIVSLKKLMRVAGEEAADDSSDENEAEKYIRVELPRNKKSGALTVQDKVQHKTGRIKFSKSSNDQTRKKRKELMDSVREEDDIQVDTKPKKKGKQLIKTAAETAISINGNSNSQEFNIRNNRCKGDFQNPLSSSGGVILKKHSNTSSKFIPGNNISFTSATHQRFKGGKSTQNELHSWSSMSKNIEQEGFANIKQPKRKGKQLIKTTAETAISINGNSKLQEFNIRHDRRKGGFQNPPSSSGGIILKKHSEASSKLVPGNNISFTSAAHQRFKGKKFTQHELHFRSSMSKNIEQEGFANIKQQSKKGRNELPDLNLPYSGHAPDHQTTKRRQLSGRTDESIPGKACSIIKTPAGYGNVTTDTIGLAQTSANRRLVSSMLTVDLPLQHLPQ